MLFRRDKTALVTADEALPGRHEAAFRVPERHDVNGHRLQPPYPEGLEVAVVAMGCFWGAERAFWTMPGVWSTAVGYVGGHTPNPTYEEVCSGRTGHTEAVLVVFDPAEVTFEQLVATFWESHDPTQGMRQGNDVGTQYRSGAYVVDEQQRKVVEASRDAYQERLHAAGLGDITTEVAEVGDPFTGGGPGRFWFAEAYHQQYLAKNPMGYCGLGGTGVSCPVGAL